MKDGSILTCDGLCKEHRGRVRPVKCYQLMDRSPWRFHYCEEAIQEDRRRGFTVETEDEEETNQFGR